MPAIITKIPNLRSNRGSVLIGVVVASILIGISVSALMGVTGTTVNHETVALGNEKAFYAAESGLLLGTSWLAMQTNWPTNGNGDTIISGLSINGATVVVRDSVGSDNNVFIISTATRAGLSYTKVLSWIVDSISGGGAGSIVNDLTGVPNGLSGITIDGPAHFNSDILLAAGGGSNDNFFMNGLVTVHSSNTRWLDPGLGVLRTGYTNDYSYGVHRKTGSLSTADGDSYFKDRYLSQQDSLVLGFIVQDPITLPASSDVSKISTLVFNPSGGATYTYYNGAWATISYPNGTNPATNGKIFLTPDNVSVNVYGTVNGQMSLATQGTGDIHIVGEIKYASGFSPTGFAPGGPYDNSANYGVSGTDAVAFFSNNNIRVEGAWTDAGVSKNFITMPGSGDNGYIAGMIYARNSIDMKGTKSINNVPGNVWFMGPRSARTFGENYWDRGNDYNPYFLYDKRFGTGAVKAAGVLTTLHRYDDNNSKRIGIEESRWSEKNIAS